MIVALSAPTPQIEPATTTAPAADRVRQPLRVLIGSFSNNLLTRGLVAIIAGSCLSLAAVLIYLNRPQPKPIDDVESSATPATAISAFEAGSLSKAVRIAKAILDDGSIEPEDTAGANFILGAIAADDAERLWGRDQRRYFKLASRYLKEAAKHGFPAGHESRGTFLLGKSLLLSGQIEEGRDVLQQALIVADDADHAKPDHSEIGDSNQSRELHRLLSIAFMSEPNARLQTALKYNALQLDDESLSAHETQEALLMQAQILFQLGEYDECKQTLGKIDPASESGVEALVVHGELLMREAQALEKLDMSVVPEAPSSAEPNADAKYKAAIATLRRAQNRGTERDRVTRRAMYLIGRCFLEMQELRAALSQFLKNFDEIHLTVQVR